MKIRGELKKFVGKQIKDVEDQIEVFAKRRHLNVNIVGWDSPGNIDVKHNRLNVHLNQNSVITGFVFG